MAIILTLASVIAPLQSSSPGLRNPPLSAAEKARFGQLEILVERNLTGFIACGRALLEIRDTRLYRERYATFEAYCRERFGLSRSTCDQLVKSTQAVETLLEAGVQVPVNTPESVIRPVANLPDAGLQIAAWRCVEAASPERGPTRSVVGRIVRTVKNAISDAQPRAKGPWQPTHKRKYPPAELPFLRPLQRLSTWKVLTLRSRSAI